MDQTREETWQTPHRFGLKALSNLNIDSQYAQHLGSKLFNSTPDMEHFKEHCQLLKETCQDVQKTAHFLESLFGEEKA